MGKVNNDFYNSLNELWYEGDDHPISLLRQESKCKNQWIVSIIESIFSVQGNSHIKVLDLACGGGFLSNHLAKLSYDVTGVDLSPTTLQIAKKYDETKKVKYLQSNIEKLPFPDGSFDVVFLMDILEHLEDPILALKEASRLTKRNGFLFYHTFNKTILSYFLAVKALEWILPNSPRNIHSYDYFIRPNDLLKQLNELGFTNQSLVGLGPDFFNKFFWSSLMRRRVSNHFKFEIKKSTMLGYMGYAQKLK